MKHAFHLISFLIVFFTVSVTIHMLFALAEEISRVGRAVVDPQDIQLLLLACGAAALCRIAANKPKEK